MLGHSCEQPLSMSRYKSIDGSSRSNIYSLPFFTMYEGQNVLGRRELTLSREWTNS